MSVERWYPRMNTLLLLWGIPYAAAFMTRHSTAYPILLRLCSIMAKSLPLCFAGDLSNLSTFSRIRYFGLFIFSSRILWMDHHSTPFFPFSPFELFKVVATE